MDIALWVLAGLLAAVFVAAGAMKLAQPRQKLVDSGMGWAADFGDGQVKAIGALEVLAAIGLVLPPLVGIASALAPLAAVGLVAMMIGAAVVHARRGETPMIGANVVLLLLAAVVAWGRFGPYAF